MKKVIHDKRNQTITSKICLYAFFFGLYYVIVYVVNKYIQKSFQCDFGSTAENNTNMKYISNICKVKLMGVE